MQFETLVKTKGITQYPKIKGVIGEYCNVLYDELLTSGYSLLLEDVQDIVLSDVRKMAGWGHLECQLVADETAILTFDIDLSTVLLADEWVVVEPVVRSHCDLVQARRMEGSQALGVMAFGIQSSEALQNYNMAVETMKKEAFHHAPFSVDYDD